jgi:DNA-binding NtrC family response regulator
MHRRAEAPQRGFCQTVRRDWLSELNMSQKQSYATSAQFDAVVLEMYRAGLPYNKALLEFKKQFVLTALRDVNWNETKAARALRMHRNTLARTLKLLDLDISALRKTKRRPVRDVDARRQKKLAS